MSTLADRISTLISTLGITAVQFADSLGISAASISLWRSGKSRPSHQSLVQISDRFGVRLSWLEDGEGDPFPPKPLAEQIGSIVRDAATVDPEQAYAFMHRFVDGTSEADIVIMYLMCKRRFPELFPPDDKKED